ncbi:MAG: LysR family transcriptional regulator [Firmicutes bacterium]|nr:LysR family transcriptional regulator [Bacillota bacterium]
MNYHHLRIFQKVSELGGHARAAEALYISQPAVSAQLKRLEGELGIPLFEPDGRRNRLTWAGEVLYEYARSVFLLEEELMERLAELKGGSAGRVRLGASTTPGVYLLPSKLGRYQQAYPGVRLELKLGNTRTIEDRLLANEIDLAVIGEDTSRPPGLRIIPWLDDRLVFLAAPTDPLISAGKVKRGDLEDTRFLLREEGSSTREVLMRHLSARGVRLSRIMELESTEAIKQAAIAGLGITALSSFTVELEREAGRLAILDVDEDLVPRRQLNLAVRNDKKLSPAAGSCLEFLIGEGSIQSPPSPTGKQQRRSAPKTPKAQREAIAE